MTDRYRIVLELAGRCGGKRVFGFSSDDGVPREWRPPKRSGRLPSLPPNWDFVCVEGDLMWVRLPRGDAE